jgi:hypothetical protein
MQRKLSISHVQFTISFVVGCLEQGLIASGINCVWNIYVNLKKTFFQIEGMLAPFVPEIRLLQQTKNEGLPEPLVLGRKSKEKKEKANKIR